MYVLDSNSIGVFQNYYPDLFPTFWNHLATAVDDERVFSVREVFNEVTHQSVAEHVVEWAENQKHIFLVPSAAEATLVAELFANAKYRELVSGKKLQQGGPVADPWIIACAKHHEMCVVTEEAHKPNSAKIPTICNAMGIDCINLRGMMVREGWIF